MMTVNGWILTAWEMAVFLLVVSCVLVLLSILKERRAEKERATWVDSEHWGITADKLDAMIKVNEVVRTQQEQGWEVVGGNWSYAAMRKPGVNHTFYVFLDDNYELQFDEQPIDQKEKHREAYQSY